MRMWMVNPSLMCRQHLLGEHVELHMLLSCIKRGKSIDGYLDGGLVEPQHMISRHALLVAEMERRGYKHSSPLNESFGPCGEVDREANLRELKERCPRCRARIAEERFFSR